MLRHLDLFSGIGGFTLAAQWVGEIKTLQFCEKDPIAQKVLKKNFPQIPIHDDITTFSTKPGIFDLVTGGYPCQDNSAANYRGKGLDGDRSRLWFEMLRIVRESSPSFVLVENVPPTSNRRWDVVVRSGLEALGYQTEILRLSSADVGANHLRKRVFIIAYSNSLRGNSLQSFGFFLGTSTQTHSTRTGKGGGGELRRGNSGRVFLLPRSWTPRVDDGIPPRLDRHRLRLLGNAVDPRVAAIAMKRILFLNSRMQF